MQTRAHCIQIKDLSISIENGAFSTDGLKYALSFSDGTVKIYQLDKQEEISSFSFSSPLTIIKFMQICNEEFLITVDIDRYVSIYRISDKSLTRKNELPFEALQMAELNINGSKFYLFAGISNKISIYTKNLMFLDNIQLNEKWIWDIQIDKKKNLFICGRSGNIEMRSFLIPSYSSSNSNFIIFIENLNRFRLKNIINKQESFSLEFPMIINSLSISSHHLLVMFKTNLYVYLFNFQDKIETNNDLYRKMFEIQGNFDGAKSDISDRNIFVGIGKILYVYSMNGILRKSIIFHSKINSIVKTEAIKDGCIIGCENGFIFFFIVDQSEPILLFKHKKAIKFAKKVNLTIALIDSDKELFVINSFTNEILVHEKNVKSFAFSDRVDNLFAYNDSNGNIYTYFLHHKSRPFYIEGNIISFFGNKVILLNGNSIEYWTPELPFEEIIGGLKKDQNDINQFYELVSINPNFDQWKLIYNIACELNISDIVLLAAQHIGKHFLPIQSSQKNILKKKPYEYEELGAIDAAIRGYADENKWEDVYRLISLHGLERFFLELSIPEKELDNAAKYLLKSGYYEEAIKLLKKSKNVFSLAEVYVFTERWLDAITLSLSSPSIQHLIFPKFAEQLFEHQNYFESIVFFFAPTITFSTEDRALLFKKLYNNSISTKDAFFRKSFICLLQGFNDPYNYWLLHIKSVAFYASNRLSKFLLLPMNEDDATTVFYLSYFVIASFHRFQMQGIHYIDILIQHLLSSAILGLNNMAEYALKEISSLSVTEPVRQIVEHAKTLLKNGRSKASQKVHFKCKRCKKDIYESLDGPQLICGFCGSNIAFSVHTCMPIPITEIRLTKSGNFESNRVSEKLNEEVNDGEFDAAGFANKEEVSDDELAKIPRQFCIVQKLKETAKVVKRLWLNDEIENVHCCGNCGAFYSETDYEDTVIGCHHCVICHSPLVDAEPSPLLDLIRPLEEDSPVSF